MKQPKTKVSIITVNFNNGHLTSETIKSFTKVSKTGVNLTVTVVDNGSIELRSLKLKEEFPKIHFIKSKKNLGFAGGNNLGIKHALKNHADYILLINNDATIKNKDFFQELLKIKGDIISPKVEYVKNGKTTLDFGGKVDYLFGRNYHLNKKTHIKPDYYSGVCLLIRSEVFRKVGLLDDNYFLYYEDVDFCLRAKKIGFKLKYCPTAKIFHHLSMSTNKLGKKKISILADSHLRFCREHLPKTSMPFYLAFNSYLNLKTLI